EQQQRRGAVMGEAQLREEVRVACPDDGIDREEPRMAVVGVEAVALPRVMAEHDVGPEPADGGDELTPGEVPLFELAVRPAEELDVPAPAERARRLPLFVLAGGHQRGEVGVAVPRALGAVGAHHVQERAPGRGPLRQRRARAELDVVGVRADAERARRRGEVDSDAQREWSMSRSAGQSTSNASEGSSRTSTASPNRRASSRWRSKDPGPYEKRNPTVAGMTATFVPSRRRSGTSTAPSPPMMVARPVACGRSPWATTTRSTPASASCSTPASTAPLSPRPGSQTTRAPRARAHSATSVSSQTTATGSGCAARSTAAAISRASAARSAGARAGARRTLASANRFTG